MSSTRILLADDHQLVRAGIRSLLRRLQNVQVVGEASTGAEAIDLVAAHRPDIVLMDIGMPGLSGLEATERITREFPEVRVVILSMHDSKEYVLQALRSGACGYLLKGATHAELELVVRVVASGEMYLSPLISKYVISAYVQRTVGATQALANDVQPQRLTPRQREVIQLIAAGSTSQMIASTLNISVKTVETYRAQIMERLDIHDVAGMVRYAIRFGLISAEV